MALLTPDLGLLFWMLVAFGIVFFVLAKFGFPVIVKMVDKRNAFIEQSLQNAREANERLAGIKEESEKMLSDARAEQLRVLSEANVLREKMLEEAKTAAKNEGEKLLVKATEDIRKAKDDALRQIRSEVAMLSVGVAEKVLRQSLERSEEQSALIERLIDESNISKS